MGYRTSLVIVAVCVGVIAAAEYTPQQFTPQTFVPAQQQIQKPTSDSAPASANIAYRARPYNGFNARDEDEDEDEDVPIYQTRRPIQQAQFRKPIDPKNRGPAAGSVSEEELEEEEPDRLSLLLEKSNFDCSGRQSGYYADEGLGCEVFHYCQETSKHSWICPEGFTFHQVHLICMPPSSDNICDQSSKYHFVNEYLYKPINMAEYQAKPNVTLRYSERYYPESFYVDERQSEERESDYRPRQPIQIQLRKQQIQATSAPYRAPTPTPSQNAYRSPEDINISLQQRRPVLFSSSSPSTPRYQQQTQQQQQQQQSSQEEEEYNYKK